MPIANTCSIGYPHDGRADKASYRHDRRADKRRYRHDRRADSLSPEEHIEHTFIECLRDNFLHQHVFEPTRFRENQSCNTLDLVISSEEEDICNLQITPSLGVSDHATIIFDYICTYKEVQNGSAKLHYSKCDTEGFEGEWADINWEEKFENMELDDMWKSFKDQFESSVKRFVPTSVPKPGCKPKPAWMTPEVLNEIVRKRRAWTRYLSTKRKFDFLEYKRVRNQVNDTVKQAKIDYEKSIALNAKKEPKRFWKYVKQKTKPKSSIGNLLKTDGTSTETDSEKADELNNFFASVFTRENLSNIPTVQDLNFDKPLETIDININQVEKLLHELNTTKSMGPDNMHPFLLQKLSKTLCYPLTIIFQKSVSTGKIPKEWKYAKVTPLFKKGNKSVTGKIDR